MENLRKGDRVVKVEGYQFPGVVVSAFETLNGLPRVVVECTAPGVLGALHVYSPVNLRVIERAEETSHD